MLSSILLILPYHRGEWREARGKAEEHVTPACQTVTSRCTSGAHLRVKNPRTNGTYISGFSGEMREFGAGAGILAKFATRFRELRFDMLLYA